MPASMISSTGGDLFKSGGGGAAGLISIPGVDALGFGILSVYDSVSIQLNETTQFFLTCDDIIKFTHFGMGVGTVIAEGTMYSTCDGSIPAAALFSRAVSSMRGNPQAAMVGGTVVTVVLNSAQLTIVAEPDTMGHFVFNLAVIGEGV